ncbi:MAG: PAS domain S-box protein [Candidatus Heimdallarchaeota archaeon]
MLLVDDDPDLLRIAEQFLTREEPTFIIDAAISAEKAFQRMKEDEFDVVVADYLMPGMDGLVFLQTLRDEGNTIPFIMFTGQGREEVAMLALNLGADHYLMKGGHAKSLYGELTHIIKQLIAHKRAEEAIKEKEEEFRSILEASPDYIWLIDREFKIRYLSRPGPTYSKEDLLGVPIYSLMPAAQQAEGKQHLERALDSQAPYNYEIEYHQPDGPSSYFENIVVPIWDNQQVVGLTISSRDITERKQAEVRLRESEKKYRNLIEAIPVGISITTPEGAIIDANTAAWKINGYDSKDELLKIHAKVLWHDPTAREQYIDLLKKGTVREFEDRFKRKDGSVFWGSLTSVMHSTEDGPLLINTFQDITERKQAEQALLLSEENHRNLVEALPIGFSISTPEGKLIEANSAAWQGLSGYDSKEEFLQTPAADLWYDPKDRELFIKLLEQGPVKSFEAKLKRKDGTAFWASATSVVLATSEGPRLIHSIQDITDRKQAEETLLESEKRFSIIKQTALEGFWIINLQGHILDVNDTLCQMLGWTREELLEMSVADIEAVENPEEIVQHTNEVVKEGYDRFETQHRCKDGTILDIEINVAYLPVEGGKLIAFIRDITDRKQVEEQLKRQKTELSEFTYAMSHDIRNRLLSIEGYAEVLESEYDQSYVEKIRHLAQNTNQLLRRSVVLANAGMVIEKTQEFNLTQLVRDVAKPIIPEHIGFELEELPTVRADPEKLSQVFQNLLENAIRHGKPSKIELRSRIGEECVCLLITNDGETILPENRSEIFKQGFSTKEETSGLGLTIVQKIVEAHGWEITLTDAPETTFQIVIPITAMHFD